jgi:hypothetical protein
LYIEETAPAAPAAYPGSIVHTSLLLAARNKPKMKLEYHLYSPKKSKESHAKLLDLPEIVRFTIPVTEQVIDINSASFDKLKNTLFLLADEIDPNQIGHRNSTVLEEADEKGLVMINAYIDLHEDYARDVNRRVWCDTSLVLFFNVVRKKGDQQAGFIVTMNDPIKDIPCSSSVSHFFFFCCFRLGSLCISTCLFLPISRTPRWLLR